MNTNLKCALSSLIITAILLLSVACGGSNANNSLKIDGKQYPISIKEIEDLVVMTGIKIVGSEIVQKFNDSKDNKLPAWMKIVINGATIEATGQLTTNEYIMFVFDEVKTTPDEIIVYNVDDDKEQLKFDGKTMNLKK